MAKRAKKSAVSRAVRTVKKAAKSAAKTTKRAAKKMMPGKKKPKGNLRDKATLADLALIGAAQRVKATRYPGTPARRLAQELLSWRRHCGRRKR